ncbi:MAG: glycosyltransferase family 2 protein [Anaerolineae bacterium]|nr:glycosyltransferase family 2 protein [Anaerolineae bacterium]
MVQEPTLDLSIVLPVYEEEGNLTPLHREIGQALAPLGCSYEIIAVDDGSRDGSLAELIALSERDPHLRVIQFRRNYGQSACFAAGFDHARGRVVFTMDADGQNDPADLPALLAEMARGDYDLVGGWRQQRKEPFLTRRLPSMIANALIGRASRVPLHDRGCSLRAYRHDLVAQIKLYGEMHRFIPELASQAGARMSEVPVNDRARRFGRSKYNLSRVPRVLLDLITVVCLARYRTRPMQLFGMLGLATGGLGGLVALYALVAKLVRALQAAPYRAYPGLIFAALLIVLGVQFVAIGLLGEMLARTYYEAQGKPIYAIRRVIEREVGEAGDG